MLFSSTIFIYLFLPFVLLVYYGILRRSRTWQNVFLFAVSLVFYAWGEPRFVLVMLASICLNWFFGLLVHSAKKRENIKLARLIIGADCVCNLSLLFVFKYLNFTASVMCSAGFDITVPSIALPIGISFFTFQAMSYVIDVYRDRGEVQKNILNVGLYIAFFPQLIAGPIVRYETVAWEIKNRKETYEDFFSGFSRFVVGLGKKVIFANAFAILADKSFNYCSAVGSISSAMAWLGAVAYTLQIFYDFSGYSDMAIGLGKMFGFHFLENFDYPYISSSVTEFWRRWHISLGTWFRDYVYFPLGGSRVKTKARLVFNLFAVWALTGIWHGAEWSFLAWGLMYFVLISVEKLLPQKYTGKVLGRIYTMFFVVMGWVLFRAETLGDAVAYIKSMFSFGIDGMFLGYFVQNIFLLVLGIAFCTPAPVRLCKRFIRGKTADILYVCGLVLVFVLSVASLVSNSYNPFIYFNF
ncbi:MAG: MBOAT family protein [Clostridia bacterium]|nr:MBOAT family protein [Clostridia bacterium]